jgi:hypothetical protein
MARSTQEMVASVVGAAQGPKYSVLRRLEASLPIFNSTESRLALRSKAPLQSSGQTFIRTEVRSSQKPPSVDAPSVDAPGTYSLRWLYGYSQPCLSKPYLHAQAPT